MDHYQVIEDVCELEIYVKYNRAFSWDAQTVMIDKYYIHMDVFFEQRTLDWLYRRDTGTSKYFLAIYFDSEGERKRSEYFLLDSINIDANPYSADVICSSNDFVCRGLEGKCREILYTAGDQIVVKEEYFHRTDPKNYDEKTIMDLRKFRCGHTPGIGVFNIISAALYNPEKLDKELKFYNYACGTFRKRNLQRGLDDEILIPKKILDMILDKRNKK